MLPFLFVRYGSTPSKLATLLLDANRVVPPGTAGGRGLGRPASEFPCLAYHSSELPYLFEFRAVALNRRSNSVAIGVVLASVGLQPTAAVAGASTISWGPCYRQSGLPFECGTLQVPR